MLPIYSKEYAEVSKAQNLKNWKHTTEQNKTKIETSPRIPGNSEKGNKPFSEQSQENKGRWKMAEKNWPKWKRLWYDMEIENGKERKKET